MKYKALFFIPLLLAILSCQKENTKLFLDLNELNWMLKSQDTSILLNNADPSDVHLSLLQAGIISDPFFRDNEKKLQWVGEKTWEFETSFKVPQSIFAQENIELVFEGLDTYADVSLNDSLILSADNMFRTWRINVSDILKTDNNKMYITFYPSAERNEAKQAKYYYQLPDNRGFTRKAAYQFGWDWSPKFITAGIWKPAYIQAWTGAKIRDVYANCREINNDTAKVMLEIDIESKLGGTQYLQVYVNDSLYADHKIIISSGVNRQFEKLVIVDPKRWWPSGYGDPNRYEITVHLKDDKAAVDSYNLKIGLKEVALLQEPDSAGTGFYFKLNGIPIFIKGANLVPMDNFLPRVKEHDYRQLIKDLRRSNINMIRVWGGGIYQNDIFYDLCDANGIMVWQDFMFACNLYPGDSQFVKNVTHEAIDNIKRIRNHPSLVLWCGNNEIDEAWHNWGWQKQYAYSSEDSTYIWKSYLNLFENILPELVKEFNTGVPYWPSSPSNGWGRDIAYKEGDVHYWGVWWGKEPFEMYNEKVGRFMSEYGFQGMPDLRTINACTWPEDRVLHSDIMNVHQKHPFGWEAIHEYMKRDYKVPQVFYDYVYVSQLVQARGIKTAIEAHRRAKPFCMGTMYWQANDCWPVSSWSGIDYFGRWKAMQYFVKKAFETYLISILEQDSNIAIQIVSDSIEDVKASLLWNIIDFNGRVIKNGREELTIAGNSSAVLKNIDIGMLKELKPNILLYAELVKNESRLATAVHFFEKPKNLALKPVDINLNIKEIGGRFELTLTTETLAKSVMVHSDKNGFFNDNYFDLLPGMKKIISFTPDNVSNEIPNFKIKCLNNIY